MLGSLPGSSEAHDTANCERFLYFSSPSRDTLQMGSAEDSPLPGLGLLFQRVVSLPRQWSGKEKAGFWHHCGNEQIQDLILNVLELEAFRSVSTERPRLQPSRIWGVKHTPDRTHQVSVPAWETVGSSGRVHTRYDSCVCIPESASEPGGAGMGR